MFDLSKIFDLGNKFALPNTFLKSKNYCIRCGVSYLEKNNSDLTKKDTFVGFFYIFEKLIYL